MNQNIYLHEFIIHYQRKVKQKCDICNSNFRLGKSQHICKRCYRSICEDCSPFKVKCYMQDYKNAPHRMCRKCHVQSEIIHQYIKKNNLKWCQDSDLVKAWLKKLGFTNAPKKRVSEKKKLNQNITFKDIWRSLNFSFRQFVGIIIDQSKVKEKQFIELINLAISQLSTNKLAEIQHVIYIVLFFLCHCTVYNAIYFTTLMVQISCTQQFSMQNMHYLLQQMGCTQVQIYKMQNILEEIFEKIVKRCTLNVFTTQMSIEIISHILVTRQFQQLEKGIAYVFYQRRQFICQNSNKPDQIILDILRNIESTDYRRVIKSIGNSPGKSDSQRSIKNLQESDQSSQSRSNHSQRSSRRNKQVQILKKQNYQLKERLKQQQSLIESLRQQKNNVKGKNQQVKNKQRVKNLEYSTSEQSNDQSNYSDIINKKNIQIIQLKKELQQARQIGKQKNLISGQKNLISQKQQDYKRIVKNMQQQIQSLDKQVQNLKSTNKKLFVKLGQLSNLIMDKQQQTIQQTNKKFQSFTKDMPNLISKQKIKQQCNIF